MLPGKQLETHKNGELAIKLNNDRDYKLIQLIYINLYKNILIKENKKKKF